MGRERRAKEVVMIDGVCERYTEGREGPVWALMDGVDGVMGCGWLR